jgi:nitrogen fixation/metabolism regulation signal transduction histidine kinase
MTPRRTDRTTRFERKIMVALVTVALVPLVGALFLGQGALREAYEVGVNPGVRTQLEGGLALYQQHFATLRQAAEMAADALAFDGELSRMARAGEVDALRERLRTRVASYAPVGRVVVLDAGGRELTRVEKPERLGDDMRPLELMRPLATTPEPASSADAPPTFHIAVTVMAPVALFQAHQRAGELFEVFTRLQSETALVSTFFLVVYMGFLLSVIVVAVAVGIVLSRRVTRRVVLLADATAQVGRGDLSVSVPSPVDDEIGELTHAFNAMVEDLRESRGRIEYLQRISAWQEFARRLAHEIKNPLTPIQLAVQEVHESYRGPDTVFQKRLDEALAIVQEEVATLRRLVGEFSAFAKLPEATLEDADLRDAARDMERALVALPEEHGAGDRLSVQMRIANTALPVRIDAMMLKRAIDNLVRNAIQAILARAPDERPTPGRVEVRVHRQGQSAVIEVVDNGPGIAADQRGRVFDPYFTTKAEGTGLGLAIVKKVVLEHGGEVRAGQSDLGGASFVLQIPLRSAARGAERARKSK